MELWYNSIAMAEKQRRPAEVLHEGIIPAWRLFVAEAMPERYVTDAARRAFGRPRSRVEQESGKVVYFGAESEASFARAVANGRNLRGEPVSTWKAGKIAHAVRYENEEGDQVRHDWCSGPLFLFAASHFAAFAHVLITADDAAFERRRGGKVQLLEDVTLACEAREPENWDEIRARLRDSNPTQRLDIYREVRRLQNEGQRLDVRPERNAWILTAGELLAFEAAFETPIEERDVTVATASAAEYAPRMGLDIQRRIVVEALRHRLSCGHKS